MRVSGEQSPQSAAPAGQNTGTTLDEVLREFTVAVPDWAREKAGITADTKRIAGQRGCWRDCRLSGIVQA